MKFVKNYFRDWTLWEKIWLFGFTALIIGLSIYWKDTVMGVTCSITGIWCVVLTAKGRISNYWVGLINVILYAIISYQAKYYGEVMLNALYFLPMQFIGAYIWIKNKKEETFDTVKTKFLTNNQRIFWIAICIISTYFYGVFLKSIGGNLPYIDAMSTTFSIVAMVLMAWRYMEQWILWIIVDVVTVIMWFVVMINGGNDISILLMWIAYLINAVYGAYNWIKMTPKKVT